MLLGLPWRFWGLFAAIIILSVPAVREMVLWLLSRPSLLRAMKLKANPTMSAADQAELPDEVVESLALAETHFAQAGFECLGVLRSDDALKGAELVFAVFVNWRSGDTAQVTHVRVRSTRHVAMSVSSEFSDGAKMVTGTTTSSSYIPQNPRIDAAVFTCVKDAATLLEVHRRRLDQARKTTWPRKGARPGATALALMQKEYADEFGWAVDSGYTYLDQAEGAYRTTWKGAILGAWRTQPRIARSRSGQRDAAAQRLWTELGMDRWTSPSATQERMPAGRAQGRTGDSQASGPAEQLPPVTALEPGSIRYVPDPTHLRVLVGGITKRRYLLSRWLQFLLIAIFVLPTLGLFSLLVLIRCMDGQSPLPPSPRLLALVLVMSLYLLQDMVRLSLGLRMANGTASLTASPDGLSFENAPGTPKTGQYRRDEVGAMRVTQVLSGSGQRRGYSLEITLRGGSTRVITLARSMDIEALKQLRNEVAWAMGIERRPEVAPVMEVQPVVAVEHSSQAS